MPTRSPSPAPGSLWAAIARGLAAPLHLAALFTAAKSFRDNPILGSAALNRRGLHLHRRLIAGKLGAARRERLEHLIPTNDRAAFERDDFVLRQGFLDPDTFAAFRSEIMGLVSPAREAVIDNTLTRLIPLDGPTLRAMPTVRAVLDGPTYRGLIDYVGSFRRRPALYVQTVYSNHCEGPRDIQSFLHADTFHPTVKSWFFLDDVEADAAPFTYVPGSHRDTRRRLAWERRCSIAARASPDRMHSEGSFRVSEPELARMGYPPPRRLPVGANTLVVADTKGFHARGDTARSARRIAIYVTSRPNPFLPWTGGDILGPTGLGSRLLRLGWAAGAARARLTRRPPLWCWVGMRSPTTPPSPG